MKRKARLFLSTLLLATLMLKGTAAMAVDNRDVVKDTNGHIVVNTFGNCVYTKWDASMDACAPEAPPPPLAAIPPQMHVQEDSRSYLVFFDFDRYSITEAAANILKDLFGSTHNAKAVHYTVTGHADRSGSDAYNLKLSERRAKAVQAELQRMGTPGQAVTVDWRGEREPLVPTDDGIKEPQNRRAEIRVRSEVMK